MTIQQLLGRRARLERELAAAFAARPPSQAILRRLSHELAQTLCQLIALEARSN